MAANCKFSTQYFDFESKKYETFQCLESSLPTTGYCIFHDKQFYLDYPRIVTEKLRHKLEKSHDGKLLLVGYNIPDFTIENGLGVPLYFNESKFHNSFNLGVENSATRPFKSASFEDCEFFGNTVFTRCEFSEIVDFSRAKFHMDTTFIDIWFMKQANFLMVCFEGRVTFTALRFPGFNSSDNIARYNTAIPLQFDYSKFEKGASFFHRIGNIELSRLASFEGVDLSNFDFGNFKFGNSKYLRISLLHFFYYKVAGHFWIFLIGLLLLAFSLYFYFDTANIGFGTTNSSPIAIAIVGGLIGGVLKALSILKAKMNKSLLDESHLLESKPI